MSLMLPGVKEEYQSRRAPQRKVLPKISNKFSDLKITALQADDTACAHYRIVAPLTYLKAQGANVNLMYKQLDISSITFADYTLIPRIYDIKLLEMVHAFQWVGKSFIYEIDDDLHHVARHNPAYTVFGPQTGNTPTITKYLKICSGTIVTTKFLGMNYANYNQNIAILDNYIDFALRDWKVDVSWEPNGLCRMRPNPIPRLKGYEDKFIIGYSGGTSHREDMREAGIALSRLMNQYNDIILALVMPIPHAKEFVKDNRIPESKVLYLGVTSLVDHPTLIQGFDVHLAPIACSRFNLSKSALKIKESMAAGAAVVASCVGPYAQFHYESGQDKFLLVGNNKFSVGSWYNAILKLYQDRDYLESLKKVGREYIIREHSLEKNHEKWAKALVAIRTRVLGQGIIGPPKDRKEDTYFKKLGKKENCPITGKKYREGYWGAFG